MRRDLPVAGFGNVMAPSSVLAGVAGCAGGEQVGVEFEQARGSHVAPLLHVVEPPDEEVACRFVDVE